MQSMLYNGSKPRLVMNTGRSAERGRYRNFSMSRMLKMLRACNPNGRITSTKKPEGATMPWTSRRVARADHHLRR